MLIHVFLAWVERQKGYVKEAYMFEKIKKRNGRVLEFDSSKITNALAKAGQVTGEFEERDAKKLTLRVLTLAHELRLGAMPMVEEIQDIVERVLLDSTFYKTAKAYIIYREQHNQIRTITTKASVDLAGLSPQQVLLKESNKL